MKTMAVRQQHFFDRADIEWFEGKQVSQPLKECCNRPTVKSHRTFHTRKQRIEGFSLVVHPILIPKPCILPNQPVLFPSVENIKNFVLHRYAVESRIEPLYIEQIKQP